MGSMKDHAFGDQPYGGTPGYKAPGTSRAAAVAMKSSAGDLRGRVLAALQAAPAGLTADECATDLGIDRLAIRPRMSELVALGLAADSGQRRKNVSGKSAQVMVYVRSPDA